MINPYFKLLIFRIKQYSFSSFSLLRKRMKIVIFLICIFAPASTPIFELLKKVTISYDIFFYENNLFTLIRNWFFLIIIFIFVVFIQKKIITNDVFYSYFKTLPLNKHKILIIDFAFLLFIDFIFIIPFILKIFNPPLTFELIFSLSVIILIVLSSQYLYLFKFNVFFIYTIFFIIQLIFFKFINNIFIFGIFYFFIFLFLFSLKERNHTGIISYSFVEIKSKSLFLNIMLINLKYFFEFIFLKNLLFLFFIFLVYIFCIINIDDLTTKKVYSLIFYNIFIFNGIVLLGNLYEMHCRSLDNNLMEIIGVFTIKFSVLIFSIFWTLFFLFFLYLETKAMNNLFVYLFISLTYFSIVSFEKLFISRNFIIIALTVFLFNYFIYSFLIF